MHLCAWLMHAVSEWLEKQARAGSWRALSTECRFHMKGIGTDRDLAFKSVMRLIFLERRPYPGFLL